MKPFTRYQCVIVEDEPIAAEIIADYINQVPYLELIATCNDAFSALETMRNYKVDVLFLDIHLPGLKGIELIKAINYKPHIIMTTAYSEYAVEAFELEVLDYLTKPIEFTRFLKAINRIPKHQALDTTGNNSESRPFKFFNTNKRQVKVYFDEILFIESLKDYVRIKTNTDTIITKGQIGWMHALLKSHGIIRIHRSFLVSIHKITAFNAHQVEIEDVNIPIGGSYKSTINELLMSLDQITE